MLLPTGIRFSNYAVEARYVHTRLQALWFATFLVALLVLPQIVSLYVTGVLTSMFIILMAVYGLQVTVGTAGQINVAQSAFMGIGAYAAAKFSTFEAPFWITIPIAGLASATIAILFALPAIRVKGFYLALTTLAAQVIFPIVVIALPSDWLGGTSGIAVAPISIGGHTLTSPADFYYFTLVGVIICSTFAFNLQRSRFGRALRAVRDNELSAEVTGINVSYYKVMSFFAGSLFAGVAGGFFAYYIRYVTTENFNLLLSIWYLGMLIVGGLASPLGAILGTVFVTLIEEIFRSSGEALLVTFPELGGGLVFAGSNVMLGLCILLALIYEPRGLAHRWNVLKTGYRIWPFPHD
jgi:branched-chain amino acid transport system permease protein